MSQQLIVDRFEGDLAIIEYEDGHFEIPKHCLPENTKEGDSITMDAHQKLLQINVSDDELAQRKAKWVKPAPRYTRGVLAKFAAVASCASRGAVTDSDLDI